VTRACADRHTGEADLAGQPLLVSYGPNYIAGSVPGAQK